MPLKDPNIVYLVEYDGPILTTGPDIRPGPALSVEETDLYSSGSQFVDFVSGSAQVVSDLDARSRGFTIVPDQRNGNTYYRIRGERGARVPGTWYSKSNLPNTALGELLDPGTAAKSAARQSGILAPLGTAFDYAIEGKDLASTDFAVDASLDVVKGAASGYAGGVATATTTSVILAYAAAGGTLGSAAPVIGTIVGIGVGIAVGVAIEYFYSETNVRDELKDSVRDATDTSDRQFMTRGMRKHRSQ